MTDTKLSDKLTSIIKNKYLVGSIFNSSHTYQTSQLEAFHSLVLLYAPKHTAFSYDEVKVIINFTCINFNNLVLNFI